MMKFYALVLKKLRKSEYILYKFLSKNSHYSQFVHGQGAIFFFHLHCSMTKHESVQYFQFDSDGNMYVFPAGSGINGVPRKVYPGDELKFDEELEFSGNTEFGECDDKMTLTQFMEVRATSHPFNMPLKEATLDELSHKKYSPETMKKVQWVTKMYRDWRNHRYSIPELDKIECDLDNKDSITKENLVFAMCRFITEVKKMDGSDFPGKTLYEILVCTQFHLESIGFHWKLLNEKAFSDVKFTLDNVMKLCTSQGVGVSVRKAEILKVTDEDFLWSSDFLGVHSPDVLLNTVIFMVGKGFAL